MNNPAQSHIRSLSELLTDLDAGLSGDSVSLGCILDAFHERGFGFFLLVFAAPMALPIPVPPGINVLLASPLILMTAQQAYGRHTIWLPESMRRKTIETRKLRVMIEALIPWMRRLEFLVRPRLGFLTCGLSLHIIGLLGLIFALTICIPLPLTNTAPSFAIGLMAVGVIMRDGLAVLAGMLFGSAWVAGLALLGHTGLKSLLSVIA